MITGLCIDAETGQPSFRGEKGYYEDLEVSYLVSVKALHAKPIRQWHWYLKRFVSYHGTLSKPSNCGLTSLEEKLGKRFLGLIPQNVSGMHLKAGSEKVFEIHGSYPVDETNGYRRVSSASEIIGCDAYR